MLGKLTKTQKERSKLTKEEWREYTKTVWHIANVTDPLTNKVFGNSTILEVRPSVGETKAAEEAVGEVSCYELPKLVQNPDGSIREVIVRICVWK